jgi:hypothetical protein
MFDRIRKALFREREPRPHDAARSAADPSAALGPVSVWAASQGLEFTGQTAKSRFAVDGTIGGRPWRLEAGEPTRRYIQGTELRARAELGIDPDVLVLVLNRRLKELMEKQAYALFTNSVQTQVDQNLPEEMRLLSMFDERGWDALPRNFWSRYAVVADEKDHASAWIDPVLAGQLLEWPAPAPSAGVPFMMMLLRGKAYLRMQQDAEQLAAIQHAATVFTIACEKALGAFRRPG